MSIHDELIAKTLMAKPETDEDYLNIDWESRLITIPSTLTNIGVYNDKDTNRLYFRCPIEYGEFKIADFGIHVNYQNTGKSNTKYDGDVYFVDDVESDGEYLTFSWLVGRHAYLEQGTTAFIVCCKVVDSDNNVVNELNTTIATLSVLEGLEVDVLPPEDYPDYLEELLRRVEDAENKVNEVADSAITGINVNGTPATVTDHVAEIEVGSGSVYYANVYDGNVRTNIVTVDIDGFSVGESGYPPNGTMLALGFRDCTSDTPIENIYINSQYEFTVRPIGAIIPSQSGMVLFVHDGGVWVSSNDPALIAEIQASAITAITVNGESVPVEDNTAEIEVSGGSNIYVYEVEINDTISGSDGSYNKSFSIVVPASYGAPVAIIGLWVQANQPLEAVLSDPAISGNTVTGYVTFQNMVSARTVTVTSATISILTE